MQILAFLGELPQSTHLLRQKYKVVEKRNSFACLQSSSGLMEEPKLSFWVALAESISTTGEKLQNNLVPSGLGNSLA